MSRYVDADALIKRMKASPAFQNLGTDGFFLLGCVTDLIAAVPTADVVEVRHGEWLVCGAFDDFLKCSLCGYDRPWQTAIEHKYCPNCGAKMDGERKEK